MSLCRPRKPALTQALQPLPPPALTHRQRSSRTQHSFEYCVWDFLKAAQDGNYSIAAQYLQMSAAHRQTEGEQTATKLKFVLDHVFSGNLSRFNQRGRNSAGRRRRSGHQKLGTMSSGDVEVDLDMVRVSDPSAGKIWLISADTLAKLPELYDQAEARQVESKLPAVLG